jgi:hypothetical protein
LRYHGSHDLILISGASGLSPIHFSRLNDTGSLSITLPSLKLSIFLPISLFYGEKELNMTTIQAASLSALEIGSSGNSSGGNDIASRISQLTKQLTKATQQLKELGLSDAPLDEKKNSRSYSNPRLPCCRHSWRNCSVSRPKSPCRNREMLRP